MTARVEIYASEFSKTNKAKSIPKFGDTCRRHFDGAAYHKHIKSKIHLATLCKYHFEHFFP